MLNADRWEHISESYEGVINHLNEVVETLEEKEKIQGSLEMALSEDFSKSTDTFSDKVDDFLTEISGVEDDDETDVKLNDIVSTLTGIRSKIQSIDYKNDEELESIVNQIGEHLLKVYEKFKTAMTVSEVTDERVRKAIDTNSGEMVVAKNEMSMQFKRVKSLVSSFVSEETHSLKKKSANELMELLEHFEYNKGSRVAPGYVKSAREEIEKLISMLGDKSKKSSDIRDQIEETRIEIVALVDWYHSWRKES